MVTEQILFSFGWAPWSCIIAGTVTSLALSIVLAILGVALGFTVITPKSDDPASGLGLAFGIWGAVSVIVSTAGGGFVAGLLAGQRGLEIGFLTWAVTMLGATCFSGLAMGAAVRMVASTVKNIGAGTVNAAGAIGSGAMDTVSHMFHGLKNDIHFDFDGEKINDTIVGVLRDTGVETLQPEHLQDKLREAKSEFRRLVHELALNPGQAQQTIGEFLEKSKGNLASLTGKVNREDAATALMNTRGIPREEAEQLVNNAIDAYEAVLGKARERLEDAKEQVEEVKSRVRHFGDQAREKADQLTSAAAKAALGAALALILAAVICMGAGLCGAKYASTWVAMGGQVQKTSILP